MPRFSVLLPTHEHAATLPYAVRSVQAQGVDDLEILICGDGVNDEVRAVVLGLQGADPRIRFFDLPKAPARGELNRDYVIRQATGEYILHQNDDDLWLPGHVAMLDEALADADFVGSMQVNVGPDGKVRAYFFDLERREYVEPWLAWKSNGFGNWSCGGFSPIFAAHRLDAYLRLPEGWVTTPHGLPADQIMWHRFLSQPWCRAKSLCWPIALQFPTLYRQEWTPARRAEELHRWTEIIEAPDYAVRLWRDILPDLGDRLLSQALEERRNRREFADAHEAAIASEHGRRTAAEAVSAEESRRRIAAEVATAEECKLRAAAEATSAEERTRRNAAESATAEERSLRLAAENALAEERAARLAAESAASDERSLRLVAENALAEERAARLAAESAASDERSLRLVAENALAEERAARLAAESAAADERSLRLAAESVAVEERAARLAAESAAAEERSLRLAAESVAVEERAARLAAESAAAEERSLRLAAKSAAAEERAARLAAKSAAAEERAARLAAEAVSTEERQQHGAMIAAFEAMLSREQTLRVRAEAERDAILASSSWRMTGPLRRLVDRLRALLAASTTALLLTWSGAMA